LRAISLLLVSFISFACAPFAVPFAAAQLCPQGWFGGSAIITNAGSRAMVEWTPSGAPDRTLLVVPGGSESSVIGTIYAWDGNRWLDLGGSLDGAAAALCIHNGDLIVVGSFQHIGGIAARGIARFDGTRWHAYGEQPSLHYLNGASVQIFDGDLVVAGNFQIPGNSELVRVARYHDGAWLAMDKTNFSLVTARFVVAHKNDIYMFSYGGFNDYTHISRWDGAKWALVQYIEEYIWAAASFGDELVVGSDRAAQFPGFVSAVAAWNGTSWRSLAPSASVTQGFDLFPYNGALYAHLHQHDYANRDIMAVSRLDGTTWTVLQSVLTSDYIPRFVALGSWRGKLSALSQLPAVSLVENGNLTPITFPSYPLQGVSLAVPDGDQVLICRSNPPATTFVAERWDGSHATRLGSDFNLPIAAFLRDGPNLYASGTFGRISTSNIQGVARFDGTEWRAMGTGIIGNVASMCVFRGDLYAAGSFRTTSGGNPLTRIARWNGASWLPVGAGIGPVNSGSFIVSSMRVFNDRLVVSGSFTEASGVPVSNVASWDGTSWSAMGSLPIFSGSLFVHRGALFGARSMRESQSLWKWTGSEWIQIAPGLQNFLAIFPHLDRIAILSNQGLAFLDNPDGSDLEFHPVTFQTSNPNVMFSVAGSLHIFGPSSIVNSLVAPNHAEWSDTLPPVILHDPEAAHACAGNDTSLRAGAIDPLPLSYRWEKDGLPISDGPHYAGTNMPELRLLDARKSMIGSYQCIISRDCAEVRTAPANVSVCYADFNCDGLVEDSDFELFVIAYNELIVPPAEPRFDQNEDGFVDDLDFQLFIDVYNRCDCHSNEQ